ncbi:MAG TPA: pyridoxal phosphate-dependent aminotransferase family protein, partial [Caldisericia bacterium]|nr:pyridoxal phosphate-dependent aminotransferase family protein [Caldisericia bacterium]
MPLEKIKTKLTKDLKEIDEKGIIRREEDIIVKIIKGDGKKGNRYILKGEENKEYIRMNSNSYLALGLNDDVKRN